MGASKIHMDVLLPQRRCHKNKFNCIGTSERTYNMGKKIIKIEKFNTGVKFKYLMDM